MLDVGVKESNVGGLNKKTGKEIAHIKRGKNLGVTKSPLRPIPTVPIMFCVIITTYKQARIGLIIYCPLYFLLCTLTPFIDCVFAFVNNNRSC